MSAHSSVPWRAACLALGGSLILLLAMFWRTAISTAELWTESRYSHGLLVIPVAAWVAWSRRDRLESLTPTPTLAALPLLALLSLSWLLGHVTATGVVEQFCLVAIIVGFTWGVIGTAAARALLFPLGFLFFAVPMGDRLIPVLQEFTAGFVVDLLRLTGVPALVERDVISTTGGSWEVARACSGISYLFSSLAVFYLYAGLAYRHWSHRAALFLLSGVVPLIANGLRVYTVVLIASLGGTRIADGIEHYLYGWLFFTMIVGVTIAIAGRWEEKPPSNGSTEPRSTTGPATRTARRSFFGTSLYSTAIFAVAGLLVVGAAPLAARLLSTSNGASQSVAAMHPEVSPPWRAVNRDPYAWRPHFIEPAVESLQSYDSGTDAVTLYAAYYRAGASRVKLASVGNAVFDESWRLTGEGSVPVTIGRRSFRVHETRLHSAESLLIVWSWYAVDGIFTGNDYFAKLLLARSKLFRSTQGSFAIAIATSDQAQRGDGATILKDFLSRVSFGDAPSAEIPVSIP